MPVLPFIEDNEENIRSIIKSAKDAGADFIYPAFGVTLRNNQREWYFDRLKELFPGADLEKEYIKRYGNQYQCTSPQARKNCGRFFQKMCENNQILYRMPDIIHSYKKNYEMTQLSLFDSLL